MLPYNNNTHWKHDRFQHLLWMEAQNNILPLQTKKRDEAIEDDANLLQLPHQQLPTMQSVMSL